MGSSRVMIWASRVWLIRSMTQAWVVDLPLPAVPVTRIMPWVSSARSITWAGMDNSSQLGMSKATTRTTAARDPLWPAPPRRRRSRRPPG